jgi:hypothetical protein
MLAAGAVGVSLSVLTACQPMLFRNDHRVTVQQPAAFESVRLPLVVRWAARDFPSPQAGSYVVFVDRDPMPPGESLDYFARGDREGIFATTETTLTVRTLRSDSHNAVTAERNHHELTVVLLDHAGRRIGESAGFVEFDVSS